MAVHALPGGAEAGDSAPARAGAENPGPAGTLSNDALSARALPVQAVSARARAEDGFSAWAVAIDAVTRPVLLPIDADPVRTGPVVDATHCFRVQARGRGGDGADERIGVGVGRIGAGEDAGRGAGGGGVLPDHSDTARTLTADAGAGRGEAGYPDTAARLRPVHPVAEGVGCVVLAAQGGRVDRGRGGGQESEHACGRGGAVRVHHLQLSPRG